jgi:uncharacterized SAM-binding protein YcdF (DUF218 family)
MFLLQKIIAHFFYPLTPILVLLLLGMGLLLFAGRKRMGTILVLIGIIFMAGLSYEGVSNALLGSLEYRYIPLLHLNEIQDVKWVVVLGGGQVSDFRLPATGQLSRPSLARLVEGIRLYHGLPRCKLLLSGGKLFEQKAEARVMAEAAIAMEVRSHDLILEEVSKDTEEEARLIQQIVGQSRFVLVTSASHMPRSMGLFKKLGMDPIPAPTDYLVRQSREMNPFQFFPKAENLYKAERVIHEYLGMIWSRLRGRL